MASNYQLRKALYKQIKSKDLTVKIATNEFFRLVKLDGDTFLLNIDIQTNKGNITIKGLTKDNFNSYNTTSDIELLVDAGNIVYVKNTSTSETTITSTSIELVKGILNESYFDSVTTNPGAVRIFDSEEDKGAFNGIVGSSSRIKNTVSSFSDRLYVGGPSVLNSTLAVNELATLHSLAITNNTTIGGTLGVTGVTTLGNILNVTGVTTITNITESTTKDNGALVVEGGIGVEGNINIGKVANVGTNLNVGGTTNLESTLGVKGVTTITNITESTTKGNGALVVEGGVGIAKKLHVGTDVNVGNILNVTGNTNLNGTLNVTKETVLNGTLKVNTIKTIAGTNNSTIVIGHKDGDNNSSITRILGRLEVEGDDLFITGTSKYEEIIARTITGADDWENNYLLIQGPNKQEGKVLIRSNENNEGIVEIGSNTNIMGTLNVTGMITGNLTGEVTGNALTATTLKTARSINGTSFDGSENITTNTWGTSRNITLGDTEKEVNGSGNLTWTRSELGIQNPTITITAGSGLKTGGNFTLNQTDPKTITLDHSNSVTAGDVGPTNNPSPGFGSTFNTPYISYDAQGHITGTVNRITTIPSTLATTSVIGLVGIDEQTFAGDKTFANNVIISGNLTVQGDNFIANTTTLTTEDDVIELRSNGTTEITTPAGIVIKKYDGTNDGGIVIKSDGEVRVGNVVMSAAGAIQNGANLAQPVLTRNEKDSMTTGNVLIWDGTNKRAVTSNQAKIGGVTLIYDETSESVRFTF